MAELLFTRDNISVTSEFTSKTVYVDNHYQHTYNYEGQRKNVSWTFSISDFNKITDIQSIQIYAEYSGFYVGITQIKNNSDVKRLSLNSNSWTDITNVFTEKYPLAATDNILYFTINGYYTGTNPISSGLATAPSKSQTCNIKNIKLKIIYTEQYLDFDLLDSNGNVVSTIDAVTKSLYYSCKKINENDNNTYSNCYIKIYNDDTTTAIGLSSFSTIPQSNKEIILSSSLIPSSIVLATLTYKLSDTEYSLSKSYQVGEYELPSVTNILTTRGTYNSGAFISSSEGNDVKIQISYSGGYMTNECIWSSSRDSSSWATISNFSSSDFCIYLSNETATQKTIYIKDGNGKIFQVLVNILGKEYTVHFGKGGKHIGIGCEAESYEAETPSVKINSDWKILHGDKDLTQSQEKIQVYGNVFQADTNGTTHTSNSFSPGLNVKQFQQWQILGYLKKGTSSETKVITNEIIQIQFLDSSNQVRHFLRQVVTLDNTNTNPNFFRISGIFPENLSGITNIKLITSLYYGVLNGSDTSNYFILYPEPSYDSIISLS